MNQLTTTPPHPITVPYHLSEIATFVTNNIPNLATRRAYQRHITDFLSWLAVAKSGFSRASALSWRTSLIDQGASASHVNQAMAAVKKLTLELAYSGDIEQIVHQGIADIPALPRQGHRLGNWLSEDEANALLGAVKGARTADLRDKAILSLFLGAALRRQELAGLTVSQVVRRDGRTLLANIMGKGSKLRTLALREDVGENLRAYMAVAPHLKGNPPADTPLFGRVFKNGQGSRRAGITDQALYDLVKKYAKAAGLEGEIAPHDLRRTAAQMMYLGGAEIVQISKVLGHSSIPITELYLGLTMNLDNPANDLIELEF